METKTFTLADYELFCENISEWSSNFEFVNGQIQDKMIGENLPIDLVVYVLNNKISNFSDLYLMANASPKHSRIVRNARFYTEYKVAKHGVIIHTETKSVLILQGNVRKPDLVFADENNEILDKRSNLLNPLAAFEVLSPSTAHIDLNEKLEEYKTFDSLQTYVIISQTEPKVWQYSRTENNVWVLDEYENMNEFVSLDFLPEPVFLFLREIYEKISFE